MSPKIAAPLSRRAFLTYAAAVAVVPSAFAAPPSRVSRVMVQGRPQDTGSLYKVRNIMPALDALGGVRKMRCRAPFRGTPGWVTYTGLANQGVKFCFTLPVKDPGILIGDIVEFHRQCPGSILSIELPNEPDLNPVKYGGLTDKRLGARTGNAPALMAFCSDVVRLLAQSKELKAIPIVAFNDWMHQEQKPLVGYANAHFYPRPNSEPYFWVNHWNGLLAKSGKTGGIITEWGRSTGGDSRNTVAPPVSLQLQATLLGSDLASALSVPSVAVINLYELLSWPGSGEQENFGLFNADLTPRPVVSVIRSILA